MTTTNANLEHLHRLVGHWATEATHRLLPGEVIRGTTTFEWMEGQRFLIQHSRSERPEFPVGMCVIGLTTEDRVGDDDGDGDGAPPDTSAALAMHYYDSRGVFRAFECRINSETWRYARIVPGFSQRFRGTFSADGNTITGVVQLCQDDKTWVDDLTITYRRTT